MDTNKRTTVALAIMCVISTCVTIILILFGVYHGLVVYEYENKLALQRGDAERLRAELKLAEDELSKVKAELRRFANPIQYNRTAAPIYSLPLSDELQAYAYERCSYYDIADCYEVVLGMMWRESNFDAAAVSTTDDYGIMQINKCNHSYLKEELGIVDIMDPYDNIESGIYILAGLVHKYESIDKALMAYNMGPGNAAKHWERGTYTSRYSRDVLAKAELIRLDKYSEK